MRPRFNPWIVLATEVVVVTASETFLKIGASETVRLPGWEWTGVTALQSLWIWIAIVLIIASFLCWIYVLRHVPLSVAFPLSNSVHVLVPLSCLIFLGENISPRRWLGIAIVIVGLAVVAQPVAKIEEKL
jgi:drug/metabolite transporter (DMT)-like permease